MGRPGGTAIPRAYPFGSPGQTKTLPLDISKRVSHQAKTLAQHRIGPATVYPAILPSIWLFFSRSRRGSAPIPDENRENARFFWQDSARWAAG